MTGAPSTPPDSPPITVFMTVSVASPPSPIIIVFVIVELLELLVESLTTTLTFRVNPPLGFSAFTAYSPPSESLASSIVRMCRFSFISQSIRTLLSSFLGLISMSFCNQLTSGSGSPVGVRARSKGKEEGQKEINRTQDGSKEIKEML